MSSVLATPRGSRCPYPTYVVGGAEALTPEAPANGPVSGAALRRRGARRYPAITNEVIERPIFVVGYGRTGTTLMHSLLGEDPASRMPMFWEAQSFSSPPGVDEQASAAAIAEGNDAARAWIAAVPDMLRAHPYWDLGAHTPIEDEEIFSADFGSAYPTHYYHVPISPLDTQASDPAEAYRFQRRFLQYRQWRTPRRHWVCKGVHHQFYLDRLWQEFPDALCVWTHRDPVEYVASTLGIYTLLYDRVLPGGVDRAVTGRSMLQSMRNAYDYVLSRSLMDDPRVVHVRFRDFMADPAGTIGSIHERAGLPFTDQHQANIRHYQAQNRADRYGKFTYSYEGFGIDADQVRETFADYIQRFDLAG